MLPTLGGKNIGKCRLRAHQHPLSPPLSNLLEPARAHPMQNVQGKTRTSARDERVLGDLLRMRAEDRLLRASILDFKPRLANRCMLLPGNVLQRAVILDFRPRLENRCRVLPVYALQRAVILDFRPRLGNRCKLFPVNTLFRASILDFKAKLANRCSVIAATAKNGPPAE